MLEENTNQPLNDVRGKHQPTIERSMLEENTNQPLSDVRGKHQPSTERQRQGKKMRRGSRAGIESEPT
ncbi:hypothetical protein RRG08_007005 [Elysia crispata]|uniref:Uncharacterized protein n=1 Tax=Elysia crispata TaxID=231223 RepID=A0AAE0XVP7_9GAST|nr:hypothetical protein RRG08_007005 [Elysia crispata]